MGEIRFVTFTQKFDEQTQKIRHKFLRERIEKQVSKITKNPSFGKPLSHGLKGERTTYVKPFRLIYKVEGDTLILLRFEHRKEIYRR